MPDAVEQISDDGSIGQITTIRFSIFERITNLILPFFCSGAGISLILASSKIFGTLMLLFGVYMFFDVLPKYLKNEAQIILSPKGIQAVNHEFLSWEKIGRFYPRLDGSGKHSTWYLETEIYYEAKNEEGEKELYTNTVDILLDELEKTPEEIEALAKLYRQRYENHKKAMG